MCAPMSAIRACREFISSAWMRPAFQRCWARAPHISCLTFMPPCWSVRRASRLNTPAAACRSRARRTSTRVTGQLRRRASATRVPSKHFSQSAIAFMQSIKATSFARTSITCHGSCRMPKRSLTGTPWRKPLASTFPIQSRCCIFREIWKY